MSAGQHTRIAPRLAVEQELLHGPGCLRDILRRLWERSAGLVRPNESNVYRTLQVLVRDRVVEACTDTPESGRPRVWYRLTEEGRVCAIERGAKYAAVFALSATLAARRSSVAAVVEAVTEVAARRKSRRKSHSQLVDARRRTTPQRVPVETSAQPGQVYPTLDAAEHATGQTYRLGVCPRRCMHGESRLPVAQIWTGTAPPSSKRCPQCGRPLAHLSRRCWAAAVQLSDEFDERAKRAPPCPATCPHGAPCEIPRVHEGYHIYRLQRGCLCWTDNCYPVDDDGNIVEEAKAITEVGDE